MGCNSDIMENIVQRAGHNIIHRIKIVHSEYQGQRTLVFYFYPMHNEPLHSTFEPMHRF